ncbi:MAG: glycosyltransferase family 4 protein [Leptonema sp. (in: bacteria)]
MSSFLKPRIIYDARMLGYSGIGNHIEETLKILLKRKDFEFFLIGNKEQIHKFFPKWEKILEFNAPIYSIQEQLFFPKIKGGIYHIPHYNAPIFFLNRSLVVVHDLIHLDSEEFNKPHYRFYAKFLLKNITQKAKYIITVSNYTKKRLLEAFPNTKAKVETIYNGINLKTYYPATKSEIDNFKGKYQLPKNFLLVVGIGKKHKNLDTLILALKELWNKRSIEESLVIAGTNAKIPEYVKSIITEEIQNKIIFLPTLKKNDLRILYSSAKCFVMPSKLEGFGFPLLEAMACGTPTISSRATSLPEIAGDATLYFDPYSIKEIQNAIVKILENSKLRNELIKKGKERVKLFSWNESIKQLIKIYQTIL